MILSTYFQYSLTAGKLIHRIFFQYGYISMVFASMPPYAFMEWFLIRHISNLKGSDHSRGPDLDEMIIFI
jgi:hypothetical protein